MKKIDYVLKAVMQKPGISLTSRDVGLLACLSTSQASQYLSRLADEGKIQRIEVGKHNLRYVWKYDDPNGVLMALFEAISTGSFDDENRAGLPSDREDKTLLYAYLVAACKVRASPDGITTEATA